MAKKKPTTKDPKNTLRKKLLDVFPTVLGDCADQLTEREALEVAVATGEELLGLWRDRLEELEDDEGKL